MEHILIKKVRHMMGMSQIEFAEFLGISQTYLCFIERGKRIPSERIVGTFRRKVDEELINGVEALLEHRKKIEN